MSNETTSGEPASDPPEGDSDVAREGETVLSNPLGRAFSADRPSLVLGASVLALLTLVANTAIRIFANLPFDPVVASPEVRRVTVVLTPLVVAAALATAALTDDRPTVRVGLLFAAVFGVIGLLAPGTTLSAVVAVVVGGALALLGTLGVPASWSYRAVRRRTIAAGFVLAIAVSLASATGIVDGGLRNIGALLALAALAAVGTRSEGSTFAAGAGLVAVVALVVASTVSPFAFGSALLVAFAVTGVPHVLVALAIGGGVAATVAGLHRGVYALSVGAGLLLLAGVPVTLPRAMTVLLGATMVIIDLGDDTSERTTEVTI